MKRPLAQLALYALIVAGCDSTPETPVDWIEVPLAEATFFDSGRELAEGRYDILVLRNSALEFKLGMNGGDAIIYHWTVEMDDPSLLTAEFHGHTHRVGDDPGTVMFYKIHNDGEESGTLVAPFDGIHGWYLNNTSSQDIHVNLQVAGFYEEID